MLRAGAVPFVVFGRDLGVDLSNALLRLPARRVLVIAPPSRRFVDQVTAAVGDLAFEVVAEARVHVPAEIVEKASDVVRRFRADTIVTVGGGSATGLGKALRLEHDLGFIAVPTTYAGSEQTDIYGIERNGQKKTGRAPRVRPNVVLYEPMLTVGLSKRLTMQSLSNALAHPVSALSTNSLEGAGRREARRAVRDTVGSLETLTAAPRSVEARLDALRAAARCGAIIQQGQLGVHHRVAHVLGGRFGLDHAALHSLLLPHTLAALAEEAPSLFAEVTEAAGVPDLPRAIFDLLRDCGAATSLLELGVEREGLERTLAERPDLPAASVRRAFHGGRPSIRIHDRPTAS